MSLKKRLLDIFFGNRVDLVPHVIDELVILRRFVAILNEAGSSEELAAKMDAVAVIECDFERTHGTMLVEAADAGFLTYQWQDLYELSALNGRLLAIIGSQFNWAIALREGGPDAGVFSLQGSILDDAVAFLEAYRSNIACARVRLDKIGDQVRVMAGECRKMIRRVRRDGGASDGERLIHFVEVMNAENARLYDLCAKLAITSF
jgi:hypothetical protein